MIVQQYEDCTNIEDIKESKNLLSRYCRCFNCLNKGHLARECKAIVSCKNCKGKHHSSLCSADREKGPTDGTLPAESSTSNNLLVKTSTRVALQTAQAQVLGKNNVRVRVLFDTASHKSFISERVVRSLGLPVLRKEWLAVNTFGQRAVGSNLRDVVRVDVTPVGGGKIRSVEAFVVPEISRIHNELMEKARKDYPHLAKLWLSDVCRNQGGLFVAFPDRKHLAWRHRRTSSH